MSTVAFRGCVLCLALSRLPSEYLPASTPPSSDYIANTLYKIVVMTKTTNVDDEALLVDGTPAMKLMVVKVRRAEQHSSGSYDGKRQ